MILDFRFSHSSPAKKVLYVLFQIILIGYVIVILYPIFNLLLSSFKTTREIFTNPFSLPAEWRFSNYTKVWQKGGFDMYFVNSIVITAVAMALVLLFGSMAANGIARYNYKMKMVVYLLFLSGIVLPLKAAIIPLFMLIKNLHLTDNRLSLVLIFAAMGLPSTVFILSGFMKTIPKELEYAARIDGCNDLVIFQKIVIPLSMPSITLVTIYNIVPIWNDFFFPLIFISTDSKKTLPLGVASFFGQYQIAWDLIFAALSIAIVPMIVVYLFMSRYFIKGMTAGAVKVSMMNLNEADQLRLSRIRDLYAENLYESVIPFWERHSIDTEYGGYFTCLERDGSVYDTDKFMWLQAREIWMFSHLYNRVRAEKRWLDLAAIGISFLERFGSDDKGDFYFALRQDGKPLVAPYNIYSDCFAVLAYAEYGKASGDPAMLDKAIAIHERIGKRKSDPKGIYNKQITENREIKTFGFSMIELNMAQVLMQNTRDPRYAGDISRVTESILRYHIDPDAEIVYERLFADGSHPNCMEGRLLCPGHVCEVLWFLAKSTDDPVLLKQFAQALKWTLERGWDREHGGIFYYQDSEGLPTEKLESEMKLWWVHNEAIYGALLLGYLTEDDELIDWFFRLHDWSWPRFVDSENGEWFGYLYHNGERAKSLKGGKWKGFFHLPRFLLESIETLDLMLERR